MQKNPGYKWWWVETVPVTQWIPASLLQQILTELDARSPLSSPRQEFSTKISPTQEILPGSPTNRTDLRLSSILGSPPPPPEEDLKRNDPTQCTNLMTSMDRIIRSPSTVEPSVSIETQKGGQMVASLVSQVRYPCFSFLPLIFIFCMFCQCLQFRMLFWPSYM